MILKTLIISTLMFSASIRDAKHSNLADYEYMIGGHNKQFNVEMEKERQDGIIYDYQEICYNNNRFYFYLLNNQEDSLNLLSLGYSKPFKAVDIGTGVIRKNWDNISPQLFLKYDYKEIVNYKYTILNDGFIHNLVVKYKNKIKEGFYLTPKVKYINSNSKKSYQAKLAFEWDI